MNIRKLTAALAVMGAFVLPSVAATTTTNTAWNIDFEGIRNPSLERGNFAGLTNKVSWTWGEGGSAFARFSSVGEDQTSMALLSDFNATNGWEATYPAGCAPANDILSLNTSGTDLQFNLVESDSSDNLKPVGEAGSSVLVDADVYFVGAESEPNVADDTSLQAALYLMCETATEDDEGANIHAGDVTNTSLRVWTYDPGLTRNVWRTLSHPSVMVEDGSWHHVQISMDYTGTYPEIKVLIDGYAMEDSKGATSFRVSNYTGFTTDETKHLNSVSFRGTGAVDNFVGATLTREAAGTFKFTAESFLNLVPDEAKTSLDTEEGAPVKFSFDTYIEDETDTEHGEQTALSMVRVIDLTTQTAHDYSFTAKWTEDDGEWDAELTCDQGAEDIFAIDNKRGNVVMTFSTLGATSDCVIAQVYYGTYPGAPTTYSLTYDLADGEWPDGYTQTNSWAADAGDFDLPNPMRDGYVFDGWTTNGVPVSFPMTIEADTAFTATWTPATFLVTFKDGETTLSSTNVLYNTPVDQPENPVKEGFEFVAWVTISGSDTNAFDFATTITEATTLYATWTEAEKPEVLAVDITSFELSGTTAKIGFTAKQAGVKYTVLTNATLTGTFAEAASKVADKSDEDQNVTIDVPNVEADAMFFKLGADWPEE